VIEVGVSVSAAVAIVFTGFVISAAIFFAAFDSTTTRLVDTSSRSYDEQFNRLHTSISIENATYTWATLTLTMKIINTGSVSIDAKCTHVLVDGKLKTDLISWGQSKIDGVSSTVWSPDTTLELKMPGMYYPYGEHPDRIKVVVEYVVSDYTTDIYIPP
jgi:archaellum component FlaF (FlaF/FlaG flagellin family)